MHDGRNVECLRVVPDQDDDFADPDSARQGHRNDAEERPLYQGPESEADSVAEQEQRQDVSICCNAIYLSSVSEGMSTWDGHGWHSPLAAAVVCCV